MERSVTRWLAGASAPPKVWWETTASVATWPIIIRRDCWRWRRRRPATWRSCPLATTTCNSTSNSRSTCPRRRIDTSDRSTSATFLSNRIWIWSSASCAPALPSSTSASDLLDPILYTKYKMKDLIIVSWLSETDCLVVSFFFFLLLLLLGPGRLWRGEVSAGEPHFYHVQISFPTQRLSVRHRRKHDFLRLRLRLPIAHMDSGTEEMSSFVC